MTTTLTAPTGALRIRVLSPRHADLVHTLARRAGLDQALGHDSPPVTVIVADDAEQALRGVRDPGPLLLVCDNVTRRGLMLALRAGAVVLRTSDLTEANLMAAFRRTGHPYQSIPYPVLSQLLTAGPQHGTPARTGARPALTARQTSVLRLMAEGHGNADIARLLSCSEHTVKNVIYEVMSRLQARNRAHAVAHAVRHGLV